MSAVERLRSSRGPLVRVGVVVAGLVLLGLLFAAVDFKPGLRHLQVQLLSGPEQGNYYALAARLGERAARRGGHIANVVTSGTVDNLARLAAARRDCSVQLALVQDGVAAPEGSGLELVARLKKSESLILLGKNADGLKSFAELRGLRIGVGPQGSGTDRLVRQLFADEDLGSLGVVLSNHSLEEQLASLERGELDLGAFVIDEDAELVRSAVRTRGLGIASFDHLDVVARRHDFLWHGRIGAGQYDPVRVLPPTDKRVLRVDTLLVSNGCASHSQIVAMLSLLGEEFPGLIEHNRERSSRASLPLGSAAKAFFDNQGPDLAETYLPWLVNIMPPGNWAYLVMAVSLLFNVMGIGHRFRLWRIDVHRVKADQTVRDLLGARLTPAEIEALEPQPEHAKPDVAPGIEAVLAALGELRTRCRKQSMSMLVPMGQEMAYRYQEDQIEELLTALRRFQARLAARPITP